MNLIKFGLAKLGSLFLVIEVLFLFDLITLAIFWDKANVWIWVSTVLFILYHIILVIEWYGAKRL